MAYKLVFKSFYVTHVIESPGCRPLPVMGLADEGSIALYERKDWSPYHGEPTPARWVYDERRGDVRLLGRPVEGAKLRRITEREE
jgi:hypothetical protein